MIYSEVIHHENWDPLNCIESLIGVSILRKSVGIIEGNFWVGEQFKHLRDWDMVYKLCSQKNERDNWLGGSSTNNADNYMLNDFFVYKLSSQP